MDDLSKFLKQLDEEFPPPIKLDHNMQIEKAVAKGEFSLDKNDEENFFAYWMYMQECEDGRTFFKHYHSRFNKIIDLRDVSNEDYLMAKDIIAKLYVEEK